MLFEAIQSLDNSKNSSFVQDDGRITTQSIRGLIPVLNPQSYCTFFILIFGPCHLEWAYIYIKSCLKGQSTRLDDAFACPSNTASAGSRL